MSKNTPIGIYLTAAEQEEAQEMARKAGISKHALLQFGVRFFLAEYRKNKKILKKKRITVIDMPE